MSVQNETDEVFDVPLAALRGEVPRSLLESVLCAASGTPSAANLQPWMFYVVSTESARACIAANALDALGRRRPNHRDAVLLTVPALVLACMDVARAKCRFGERGARLFGIQDVAVAVHRVRAAAWQRGVGSCWVRELDFEVVGSELGLSPRFEAHALLAFGRGDLDSLERPPRLPGKDFIRQEGP